MDTSSSTSSPLVSSVILHLLHSFGVYFYIFSTRFECIFFIPIFQYRLNLSVRSAIMKNVIPNFDQLWRTHTPKWEKINFTLETSGEDVKTTLETSLEDLKTTLETSVEDLKTTLETSGEDLKTTLEKGGEDTI